MNETDIVNTWGFIPDQFQKQAIDAIHKEHHTLITAHTGSGKTFPAEYAIKHICQKGKKVIYTSPIKSLSNQKFNEFTRKHTDITFGILTGDIKFNPEADCLIMTTEILRNTLFHKERSDCKLLFDMDFQNELACVIFDEVHYINDKDRGKVWEECIMSLPSHVFTVMLSATISNTQHFANWVETATNRKVEICSNSKRVIPLVHQTYMTVPNSFFKTISKQDYQNHAKNINNFVTLKTQTTQFDTSVVHSIKTLKKLMYQNNIYIKHSTVLHRAISKLQELNLLPAICFVFSRKQVERYANDLHINLSDNPDAIEHECETIMKKIPNYKEYTETNDYKNMVSLLRKGIAIHHSGLIPILKEVIEMLFSKGLIKILFATETFAVGVNMPAKTVMFANFQKYSNGNFRELLPHEYTQMAGRAGRRGLDTVGYVIHLLNLIGDIPPAFEYTNMVTGPSQQILSRFEIDHNLILKLLLKQDSECYSFLDKSMMLHETKNQLTHMKTNIDELKTKLSQQKTILETLQTNPTTIKYYQTLLHKLELAKNKQKKNVKREIEDVEYSHKFILRDLKYTEQANILEDKIIKMEQEYDQQREYTTVACQNSLCYLKELNMITENNELTQKGLIATHIQEINCIIAAELIINQNLVSLSAEEIAAVLSIFATQRKNEPKVVNPFNLTSKSVANVVELIENKYNEEITYDLCDAVLKWCQATTENQCKVICEEIRENNWFIGDFIKTLLKINNIAKEFQTAVQLLGNVELEQKLSTIPELTLKHLVSNQSIYV